MSGELEARRIDWWIVLPAVAIALAGLAFVHSATAGTDDEGLARRQLVFLAAAIVGATCAVVVPYARFHRAAWGLYAVALVALVAVLLFGSVINGARRWIRIPGAGFLLQPSEFGKLALVLALASWFRFRDRAKTMDGVVVPALVTAIPALLVFAEPDLGSSLVYVPILVAMAYVAGVPGRSLAGLVVAGALLLCVAWFTAFHDYQRGRVEVWAAHFGWDRTTVLADPEVREVLLDAGYQPWQSLIAIGGGGLTGFGYGQGPQNRFDFLPYRAGDYVFAVVGEELGWFGAMALLGAYLALVLALLALALRTRERFGRLLVVGVAVWLGTQAFLHVAVCAWLVPSKGLPLPLVSQGGSVTLAAALGIGLCLNVGARREPVLAADGFR
ncbi:MAG: FtsW/RodA/SpoVE family cell cycle protein [Planctomycetes bacterium]|nr:FtsW/RodA/SpoVE family cell cycle protein [Planctomycetota bacterium]